MHILHVIDTLRPGGAQRALVEIANQTREQGVRVSVCVTRSGCDMAAELDPRIELCVLERARRFDWGAMRRLSRWIGAKDVDLIHAHGRTTLSFVAFMRTAGLCRTPMVMHDHTGRALPGASAPFWFRGWAKRHVAHYVGVHEPMDAWAAGAGIPRGRRSVIPCGLDVEEQVSGVRGSGSGVGRVSSVRRQRARENCSLMGGGDPRCLNVREVFGALPGVLLGICLGGIRPEKGIDTLLRAVARSDVRGRFQIVIVGGSRSPAYYRQCLEESKRLGVEDQVVFAGEYNDVKEWLGQFDFAVHAARSESGPLAVIEHLAAGLPLICTRVGGIALRAEGLGVERFIPPDDPVALAKSVDELVDASPRVRARRAQHGKDIAARHFDIRAVMPAWTQVYHTVLHGRYR